MDLFYSDHFVLPLPADHRFPMSKYSLLRERLAASGRYRLHVPPPVTDCQLALAHDPGYIERVVNGTLTRSEVRALGFPWSPELVERSRRSNGASVAAARTALDTGAAGNLAGGTHHAQIAAAQGFCVFNDFAVAARVVLAEGAIRRALIVDCDVHQGNGTAQICAGDERIFTLSLHGARNFPTHKEASDLDVALADGTGDEAYLRALDVALAQAFSAARPDIVFYLAGADPYSGDRLGRLALTMAGLAARDACVVDYCRHHGVPTVIAMGGGYARDVEEIVTIHAASVECVSGLVAESPG